MDLLLRGRGADNGARAPFWLLRLCGAAVGIAAFMLSDLLGITDATGLSPLLLSGTSALLGALIAPSALGAFLWLALGGLVTTTMIVAFTPITHSAALHYVRRDVNSGAADAVIVLSGSMTREGLLSGPVLGRFISGVNESRSRKIGVIALSVIDNSRTGSALVTSEGDQTALMQVLAPDVRLMLVRDVKSTRDEALKFLAIARSNNWKRVVLVTSPLHTRRACRTFETVGLPVICVPGQAREYSLGSKGGMHSRLNVFRDVLYETTATLVYGVRGWM